MGAGRRPGHRATLKPFWTAGSVAAARPGRSAAHKTKNVGLCWRRLESYHLRSTKFGNSKPGAHSDEEYCTPTPPLPSSGSRFIMKLFPEPPSTEPRRFLSGRRQIPRGRQRVFPANPMPGRLLQDKGRGWQESNFLLRALEDSLFPKSINRGQVLIAPPQHLTRENDAKAFFQQPSST